MSKLLGRANLKRMPAWIVLAMVLPVQLGCRLGADRLEFKTVQEPWSFQGIEGRRLVTDHFDLFTTVSDAQLLDFLPGFLEATYQQYSTLFKPSADSARRLETYFFANKHQWLAFTRQRFPDRYEIYSRVQVAGYARDNLCVVHYVRPRTYTLSIIAHEGMHQYLAAQTNQRIPAWLNEGLACYCEGFDIRGGRAVFDPMNNSTRRNALREMLASDGLMPLSDLLGSDAGQVMVNSQGRLTRTYYAQAWALMVYLHQGARGRYAGKLKTLLTQLADGTAATKAQAMRITTESPHTMSFGQAIFRAYISDDVSGFEKEFRKYMVELVGF